MDLDLALESAFIAALYVDYRQTRTIAADTGHDPFHENNPILGSHPSPNKINGYFIAGALAHAAITYTIPKGEYRTGFQLVTLGFELGATVQNFRIGVRF